LLAMLPAGLGRVARLGDGDRTVGILYRQANPGCRFHDLCWTASWRDEDPPEGLDCLIYDGVLAHFERPAATVRRHLDRLAPGGRVLVALPNIQHWAVIEGLLKGRPVAPESGGRLPVRLFTLDQALSALSEAGLGGFEIASCARADQNGAVLPDAMKAALRGVGVEPEAFAARSAAHLFVVRTQRQRVE
ncbi:MAG: hypothetical protein HQL40_12520, partial [Alphaproteobacteria bacterium]|nr:hypothetical protein [Alphaproteobacteria bacterium]